MKAFESVADGVIGLNEGMYLPRLHIGECEDTGGFGLGWLFCNSLIESMGVTNYLNNGIPYLVTAILQATSFQCGFAPDLGHVPVRSGNVDVADGNWGGLNQYDIGANDPYNMVFAYSGTGSKLNSISSGDALNRKQTLVSDGTSNRIGILLDGTVTPIPRRATRIDAILGPGGLINYDVQDGGTTFIGAGTATGGTSTTGTQNTAAYAAGDRKTLGSGFSALADLWVQLSPPATGNLNCDGIIVTNSNRGFQSLNGCRVGASLWDTYNAATKAAMITTPTLRSGAPLTNLRLGFINYITNECITEQAAPGTRDPDEFESRYQTRLTDMIAAGIAPVMIIPAPYDQAVHSYTVPWSVYAERIRKLRRENGCLLIDLWKATGSPTTHAIYETLGHANLSFGRHLTDKGARWTAWMIASALIRGLTG